MPLPAQWELAGFYKKSKKQNKKKSHDASWGPESHSARPNEAHKSAVSVCWSDPISDLGAGLMEETWERGNIEVFWLVIVYASLFNVFFFSSWHWRRELTSTWNQSLPVTAHSWKIGSHERSEHITRHWFWLGLQHGMMLTVCLFYRPRVSASAIQRNSHQLLRGWTEAWQVSDRGVDKWHSHLAKGVCLCFFSYS